MNLERSEWIKIWEKLDLNKEGNVDFHEFRAAAIDHDKLLSEENLKYLFDLHDIDQDGYVSKEDFK